MKKNGYTAIGLMSGTSLDGVDASILRTDGTKILELGAGVCREYSVREREVLLGATHDALQWHFHGPKPDSFRVASKIIEDAHIGVVRDLLATAGMERDEVDIVGFHGQTVIHQPPQDGKNGQTLQIGRAQVLAETLGVDVCYDFRSRDMEHGGQGAPLVPVYHQALADLAKLSGVSAIINIGGVSNLTLISPDGEIFATDCGPGNGPIDAWVSKKGAGPYDIGGRYAMAGQANMDVLQSWLTAPFFHALPPKSADRWQFDVLKDLEGYNVQDGAATLATFCAFAIAHTLEQYNQPIENIIVCGGGRYNQAIMDSLAKRTKRPVQNADELAWDGDFIEAQAFAYLAVRALMGLPITYPQTTGVSHPLCGGQLVRAK
ncbi:MAG TPA: anhydro-N-acetylmuramic acid kinase [Hellea balneolensis]|uniref:Anhydro-N-acetylmuramic acid kinase n=1 Tax=Hellea balneolensis TaxID=287478 RepID=A0A7C5LWF0_9PROT|nr:anhydro-N-acetylmuramic acid kinase [Hellea balneolensis]